MISKGALAPTSMNLKPNKPMKHLRGIILLCLLSWTSLAYSQRVGIGTNALYWATLTPNANVHLRMSQRTSLNLEFAARPKVSIKGTNLTFANFSPEVRFWLTRNGGPRMFWGVALQSALYAGQWSEQTYRGSMVGAGPTFGFTWMLGERFNLEATLGAGVMYIGNRRTPIYPTEAVEPIREHLITPAPIKFGVNFIYYIR